MCIRTLFQEKFQLPDEYKLVFLEDFTKWSIDWNRWSASEHWSNGGFTQKENTIWTEENVIQTPEGLALRATSVGGINFCGMINSFEFLNFKFGFVEIEAKMPPRGFLYFPALWMYNREGWLPEIDIVELMGKDSKEATFTHHWDESGKHLSKGKCRRLSFDLSEDFHRYAIEWTPERIGWYIDRVKMFEVTANIPQVPLHLVCNIQAGGDPPFTHVFTQDEFPAEMIIKTINIYQKP